MPRTSGGPGPRLGVVLASTTGPAQPRRLGSLDVLRGVAILGTLGTNIWIFTVLPLDPADLGARLDGAVRGAAESAWSSLDSAVMALSDILTNGKFLGLLSILFGVGMAIQYDAARRHGLRWPWRYQWRSLLLLADGFLHFALVVEFDILMGYAVVAMLVAPLLLLRHRWLVAVTVLFGLLHLALDLFWAFGASAGLGRDAGRAPVGTDERADALLAELAAVSGGSYLDQVAFRLDNFWVLRGEAFVLTPALTAFLFLSGVLLWRAGLFDGDAWARRTSRILAAGGLGIGMPLSVLPTTGLLPETAETVLASLSRYTIAPVVAFGYLGLILVLLERRGGSGFLARRLAEVGRTALSCYVLQNVIASVAFYGWGLELGPLGSLGTVVAWAVISAVLVAAAHLWLRRFRQGPLESVQRRLVDAPFRRADRAARNGASSRSTPRRNHAPPHRPCGRAARRADHDSIVGTGKEI